jgi:hypothetical protein
MNNTKSLENPNLTLYALAERQANILIALTQSRCMPTISLLEELAELGIALEDEIEMNHVECDPHRS